MLRSSIKGLSSIFTCFDKYHYVHAKWTPLIWMIKKLRTYLFILHHQEMNLHFHFCILESSLYWARKPLKQSKMKKTNSDLQIEKHLIAFWFFLGFQHSIWPMIISIIKIYKEKWADSYEKQWDSTIKLLLYFYQNMSNLDSSFL